MLQRRAGKPRGGVVRERDAPGQRSRLAEAASGGKAAQAPDGMAQTAAQPRQYPDTGRSGSSAQLRIENNRQDRAEQRRHKTCRRIETWPC